MSSNSNTIRSRYQSLPRLVIRMPAMVGTTASVIRPYTIRARPIAANAFATFGTGERNCAGISTALRSDQTRSPRTLFDAQFRVDRGGGKNSGLTIIQVTASAIGMRQYQPIQSRLQ